MKAVKDKHEEEIDPIQINLLDEEKDESKNIKTKVKYNYKWLQ
jgi:hypothetical protein